MSPRYRIQTGKFCLFFEDTQTKKALTLNQVLELLEKNPLNRPKDQCFVHLNMSPGDYLDLVATMVQSLTMDLDQDNLLKILTTLRDKTIEVI